MATARPDAPEEDKIIETWLATTPASTFVFTWDRRTGEYEKSRVGGGASQRLEISRDCRKYNQSRIPPENIHLDPFTNGSLRLIRAATEDETLITKYHSTEEDLLEYFKIQTEDAFAEGINDIDSEVILRRLLQLSEIHGRVWQRDALHALIQKRHPVGGTQRTVREMEEAERRASQAG